MMVLLCVLPRRDGEGVGRFRTVTIETVRRISARVLYFATLPTQVVKLATDCRVLTPKAHHATDVRILKLVFVRTLFTVSMAPRNGIGGVNDFVRIRVPARI